MSRLPDPPEPEQDEGPKAEAEVTSDGATVTTGALDGPLTDWAPILRMFQLDPDVFEVVDDTVRMSTWWQSARAKDGDRDKVQLWSYKARFRRITPADRALDLDAQEARRWVRSWEPESTTTRVRSGRANLNAPVTYVHHQGDEQSGKAEGGGIAGLAQREADVLQRSIDHLRELLKAGHNIEAIADLSAGDRVENIVGHYASQPRTTDTLRNQLKYARDADLARTKAFAAFDLPIVKVYTPSNHGEMRPGTGLSPLTSASDNLDLIIAESVRDVTDETDLFGQLEYVIPHDEWLTKFTLSGVNCGLSHGHKAGKGKPILKWVAEQRDYHHFHHGFRMELVMTGHLHHGHIEDAGGTWLIQPSALDGGSPYFEASTGTKSAHGALGYLVGKDAPWRWSHMTPL